MGHGSTQPLPSHPRRVYLQDQQEEPDNIAHPVHVRAQSCICFMCTYPHHGRARTCCSPVRGQQILLVGLFWGSLLLPPHLSAHRGSLFFPAASIRLVLVFSWSEFGCTVAFQLFRFLGFCMVFPSSVNKPCTRTIAEPYPFPLLAAQAAFSRYRVQAMKPFVKKTLELEYCPCTPKKQTPVSLSLSNFDFK